MVYMGGGVVDFIYHGEANIYQEDLDVFLALAEELQLKGLAGAQDDTSYDGKDEIKTTKQNNPPKKTTLRHEDNLYQPHKSEESDTNTADHIIVPVDAAKLLMPFSTNNDQLKAQLDSMMVKAEDGEIKYVCTVCGKIAKGKDWGTAKRDMRKHIETHIEGLSYTCNQCGKVSR